MLCKWSLDHPPQPPCLHWREGLAILASRKLIQPWLTGTTGDGGTAKRWEISFSGGVSAEFCSALVCPRSIPLPRHSFVVCFFSPLPARFPPCHPTKRNCFEVAAVIIWALCSGLLWLKRSGCWRCSAVFVVKTLELLEKYSFSVFSYPEKNIKSMAYVDASVSSIVRLSIPETAGIARSLICAIPLQTLPLSTECTGPRP